MSDQLFFCILYFVILGEYCNFTLQEFKHISYIIIHNIIAKKALLMILEGWGIGKHGKGDVIYNTPTPYLDYLTAVSAHSQLLTCGEDVGLPDGQMGNSEVGHLNIGAGRIVY